MRRPTSIDLQHRLAAARRAIPLRHAAIVLLLADREATLQAPHEVVFGFGGSCAAGQQPDADGPGRERLQHPAPWRRPVEWAGTEIERRAVHHGLLWRARRGRQSGTAAARGLTGSV